MSEFVDKMKALGERALQDPESVAAALRSLEGAASALRSLAGGDANAFHAQIEKIDTDSSIVSARNDLDALNEREAARAEKVEKTLAFIQDGLVIAEKVAPIAVTLAGVL